jgi:hypothetical protein
MALKGYGDTVGGSLSRGEKASGWERGSLSRPEAPGVRLYLYNYSFNSLLLILLRNPVITNLFIKLVRDTLMLVSRFLYMFFVLKTRFVIFESTQMPQQNFGVALYIISKFYLAPCEMH